MPKNKKPAPKKSTKKPAPTKRKGELSHDDIDRVAGGVIVSLDGESADQKHKDGLV
jgi:hypothetical protein